MWPRQFLEDLFSLFNEKKQEVVLMRSYDWLAGKAEGDIDLLVRLDMRVSVIESVEEFANREKWQIVYKDKDANHTHIVLFQGDESAIRSVHLDVQHYLGRKGFYYSSIEQVTHCTRKENHIRIQDGVDEIYALLLHVLLDKDKVKPFYRDVITKFNSGDLERKLEKELGKNQARAIVQWKEAGLPDSDLEPLKKKLRLRLKGRYLRNRLVPRLHKVRRVSRYLTSSKGVLIAALGPDGSGKSTVVEGIEQTLSLGAYPIQVVYMGKRDTFLPTSHLIRWYFKRKKMKKGNRSSEPEIHDLPVENKKNSFSSKIIEILGLTNWFLEQWARYLVEIRPVLAQGGVVLCDRFIYDLADRNRGSVVYSKLFLKFLVTFFPVPNSTYFFWESPEVLYERKKENTIARNEFLIENYRAILSQIPNSAEVRTNIPPENIINKVSIEVANKMASRW